MVVKFVSGFGTIFVHFGWGGKKVVKKGVKMTYFGPPFGPPFLRFLMVVEFVSGFGTLFVNFGWGGKKVVKKWTKK